MTDQQLLNNLEAERDRYRWYLKAAKGDQNGYRVAEIKAYVCALEREAAKRGLE